jgi:uncharacterized sulfatase
MQGHPFLGSRAEKPRRYIFAARDRMDERYDIIRAVRDERYKYIRNYEPFKTYAQSIEYAERGPTMKEIRRLHAAGGLVGPQKIFLTPAKPTEELYDLQADPHEVQNLAESPALQPVLKRMRSVHEDWMDRTIDVGLIPESEIAARTSSEPIYDLVRKPGHAFPSQRLRDAASLATNASTPIERLSELCADADPAIRYWGVVGLGQAASRSSSALDGLTEALTDDSPTVRIAAAQALCLAGDERAGLNVLVRELANSEEIVRVTAAYALDGLGERSRDVVPQMQAALKDDNKYVVRLVTHALENLN